MARGIFRDLAGKEIGLWKVLQRGPTGIKTPKGQSRTLWLCLCVGCDRFKLVDANRLMEEDERGKPVNGRKGSTGCVQCRGNFNWEARDEARELRAKGWRVCDIARKMKVSLYTVWRYLNTERGYRIKRSKKSTATTRATTRTDRPPAGQLARPQPAGIPS